MGELPMGVCKLRNGLTIGKYILPNGESPLGSTYSAFETPHGGGYICRCCCCTGVVVVGVVVVVVVVIDGITAYVAGSSNTHVRAYRPFCLTVLPTKAGFLHGVCV
jgi:hypothetical protein